MKKMYFLSLLFFGLMVSSFAFGQCNQDITLNSQADIDNFVADYGCTQINGDLTIGHYDVEDNNIVDFSGLSEITSIEGSLRIGGNDLLTSLDGLNNLVSVGEDLYIGNYYTGYNPSLSNIDALNNLNSIGGEFWVLYNPALTDIDGFDALSYIGGDVTIEENHALLNISGLNIVDSIGGFLNIYNNDTLLDITGFNNLNAIVGKFDIIGNNNLVNITGFNNLNSIGEEFYFTYNHALISIDGFSALTSIGGEFQMEFNNALTNVDGLSSLTSVGEYLMLREDALTNIDGLSNLTSVESLFIDCPILTNIDAFSKLTSIETHLTIRHSYALTDLDGLSNIDSIGGGFWIFINDALTNLDGLNSISYIGGDLNISRNELLELCCVVPYLISVTQGEITLEDNGIGCNFLEEINGFCSGFKISAQPFYDQNENGVLDITEQPLYLPFAISPEALYTFNYEDGTSTFFVEPDTYILQYDNASNSLWQVNGADSYFINITDEEEIDTTFYFPMQPVTDFIIQNVDVTSSITRCNRESNIWLTYTNKSSEPTSGYVLLIADELTTFVSATPPVDSIAGDTLFWFYEDLYPTHSEQIHVICEMPGVGTNGENVGENLQFYTQMSTWEGYGASKATLFSELICAYDPNDKLVTPSGVGDENYTLFEDSLLHYTIRCQNTGNDTAFNISILDTIQDYLDISTFQFIASSHDVDTKIDEKTRIIEFLFEDIYLPDSNVNEPGSHGFVKFSIETNSNLEENTLVENTAGIFFDFNPAIITNTTSNTMVSEIPQNVIEEEEEEENTEEKQFILLYPNPNTGSFALESKDIVKTLKVYNGIGQLMKEKEVNETSIQVDMSTMRAGIYFVTIETEIGVVVEKVLVQ